MEKPVVSIIQDAQLSILDSAEKVPSIYIDGMQGLTDLAGVSKIGLFEVRHEYGPDGKYEPKKVMVARLVLPSGVLPNIVKWLGEIVASREIAAAGQPNQATEATPKPNG